MTLERVGSQEGLGQFVDDPNKNKAGLARVIVAAANAWIASYPDIPLSSVATSDARKADEPQPPQAETVKVYPEISLEEEWQRQIKGFIRFGFHTELNKTEEEYAKRFPEFSPQPESFKGRFDTPVLVETEISPKRQCELVGIGYFLDGANKENWNENRKHYTVPEAPYPAWLNDGRGNLDKKPEDVRRKLKDDEIAGTEYDGIALYISNPEILKDHFLDLPGTSVGSDRAAYLRLWLGRPGLDHCWVGDADPRFGSVVRGRQK